MDKAPAGADLDDQTSQRRDLVQPLKVCYNLLSACLHQDLIFLTPDEPEGEASGSGLTCCFAAYKLGLCGVNENTDLPAKHCIPCPWIREPRLRAGAHGVLTAHSRPNRTRSS